MNDMRIAYFSNDELDQALAAGMARECGAVICPRNPEDPPPDGPIDAVLYNLDDLPRDRRSVLLEELRRAKPGRPTAVHGYDLTEEQARALDRHGVAASRRLHPGLILSLVAAARCDRETVPEDDAGTELTWINLVS
jgi:hypothetical protein